MAPARLRLACVGLCLFLGLVSPARAEDIASRDATDAERDAWAQDLRQDPRLEIRHEEIQRRPVSFPTTLPCEYMDRIEHVNKTLKGDQAVPVAEFLAQMLEGPPSPRTKRSVCPYEFERDNITVSSGKGDKAVVLTFSPAGGTVFATNPKNHSTYYLLGSRAAAFMTLLGDAFPDDARLLTIVPCTDTVATDTSQAELPKPGDFVYVEQLPEVTSKVKPYYPPDRIKADVEGVVMVQALVSKEGEVAKTAVLKSIEGLDEHAVRAVEQWKFKPAKSNGDPLAVWVAIPVKFRLQ